MADDNQPKSISKVRTFKQDYERIKGVPSVESAPVKKVVPDATKKTQPDTSVAKVRSREQVPLSSLHKTAPKVIKPTQSYKPVSVPEIKTEQPVTTSQKNQKLKEELSAEINTQLTDQNIPSGASTTSPDIPQVSDDIATGSIITDTKKDRHKLLPAIWKGLKGWFSENKEEFQERLEPKEKVTPGTTRKEVISKAAAGSALAPHDDYAKVSERLKQTERVPEPEKVLSIKNKEEVAAPTWSHTIGEEGKEVEVVETEKIPEENTPIQPTEPAPEPVVETTPKPVPQPVEEPEIVEPAVVETAESVPEPVPEPEPVPTEPEPELTEEVPTPEPEQAEVPQPQSKPRIDYGSTIGKTSSQPDFSIPLITAAVVISVIAGISLSVWLLAGDDPAVVTDQTQTTATNLVATGNNLTVPLGISRSSLLEAIANTSTGSNIATIYPSHNAGPATTDEILTVLDWKAPGAFLRNISDITFGLYKGQSPFIVIKVQSFETGYGGMLNWESDLSSDLTPLFGSVVISTFDPTSRTNTQTRPAYFIDKAIGTYDVRLLKDEKATDRIAYTFINQTTILITDSVAALEEIAPYIK